jgi:hypothetical protein
MPPHKLEQIIGEQSKEKEFLLKMIGIPCRERESENRCWNSIQALICIGYLRMDYIHKYIASGQI